METTSGPVREAESVCGPATEQETALAVARVSAQEDRGLRAQETEVVLQVAVGPVPAQGDRAMRAQETETVIKAAAVPVPAQVEQAMQELPTAQARSSHGAQGFQQQDPITGKTVGIPLGLAKDKR